MQGAAARSVDTGGLHSAGGSGQLPSAEATVWFTLPGTSRIQVLPATPRELT